MGDHVDGVVYAPRLPGAGQAGRDGVRRAHFRAWFRRVHGDPGVVSPGLTRDLIRDLYGAEFAAHEVAATACGFTVIGGRQLVKVLGEPFVCVEPGDVVPGVGVEHPDEVSVIGAWAWDEDEHD